jgi:ribonuclease D
LSGGTNGTEPQRLHATTAGELAEVATRIASADSVAFDTEFMWEKTYRPVLALLQIATPGFEAIIDPLQVEDVGPVWEAIASAPVVIVHAGEHDLGIMVEAIGRLPDELFDTQLAAAFAGRGESVGYSSLVHDVLGAKVRGGEGYTDWIRRPLTAAQLDYAIEDVRHLHPLWEELASSLERTGRIEWLREETALRLSDVARPVDPSEMWRRVKGANRLSGGALNVLREVTAWREREAIDRDVSRRRLVPDQVLIEIAKRSPTDPDAIARLRGLHQSQARSVARPLAEAVRRAASVAQSDWPRWPPRRRGGADPAIEPVASVLHGVMRMKARELSIAPGLIATRSDLEEVVRRRIAGEPEVAPPAVLAGWRRQIMGDDLLHLLDGEARLRLAIGEDGPAIEIA